MVTPYLKQGLKSSYLTLTSDLCDSTTIPEKSETLIEKIIKKKVILISSMTYTYISISITSSDS